MKFKYVEAHKVKGLTGPEDELLLFSDDEISCYLVSNPSYRLQDVDTRNAIANLLLTFAFQDLPDEEKNKKFEELVEERVLKIQKDRAINSCAYLIVELNYEVLDYKPESEYTRGKYHLVVESHIRDEIRHLYDMKIKMALLSLSLLSSYVLGISRETDGLVILSNDGKITYPFHFKPGSISAYVSIPLQQEEVLQFSNFYKWISSNSEFKRVFHLLVLSYRSGDDKLRMFLNAFFALEIFVSKIFRNYQLLLENRINAGTMPILEGEYVQDILTEKKEKYSLLNKFCVIAIHLDESNANSDAALFMKAKQQRDDLAHGQDITDVELDFTRVRELLKKYLLLYFNSEK